MATATVHRLLELVLQGRFCDSQASCLDGTVPCPALLLAVLEEDPRGMRCEAFRELLAKRLGVKAKQSVALDWAPKLLALAGLCAWAPAVSYKMYNNGFFMDDAMIARNANVYEELDWNRLFRTDYWGLEMFKGTWTHKSFRPLTVLSFRFNFLMHGFESSGFHITNLLLHLFASILLVILAMKCGLARPWARFLGLLFLNHPVHTESVLYIVGRADLICLALIILAFLTHLQTSPTQSATWLRWIGGVPVSSFLLLLAGLSKETGFCFFGLLVGWDILSLSWRSSVRLCVRLVLVLLVGMCSCMVRLWYTSGTTIERMDPHSNPVAVEEDAMVRALSYALVHGIYGKLLVWPVFLCYDYSFDAVPAGSHLGRLPPVAASKLLSGIPGLHNTVVRLVEGEEPGQNVAHLGDSSGHPKLLPNVEHPVSGGYHGSRTLTLYPFRGLLDGVGRVACPEAHIDAAASFWLGLRSPDCAQGS